MNKPYITTEHLYFYYAKQAVLHDINANFYDKKINAIVGPSGSGKSTLLRTMNRIYELYPAQSVRGNIMYQQHNILDKRVNLNQLRSKIGMVFQKPTPFPMSIFDNIAFPLKQHMKLSKAELAHKVETALRQASLWDEVKDKLHEAGSHLSGGQQQRLCFARTLAIEPDVLLLDEPSSALDPVSKANIHNLIKNLREHYCIIFVTHDLATARDISDQLIFLEQGHLIEQGPTQHMFTHPQHPKTQAYLLP